MKVLILLSLIDHYSSCNAFLVSEVYIPTRIFLSLNPQSAYTYIFDILLIRSHLHGKLFFTFSKCVFIRLVVQIKPLGFPSIFTLGVTQLNYKYWVLSMPVK